MTRRLTLLTLAALTLSSSAGAQIRLGLQGSYSGDFGAPFVTGGVHATRTAPMPFAFLSASSYRQGLEVNLSSGPFGPNLLVDTTLLWTQPGGLYTGAGLGTGLGFPPEGSTGDLPYPAAVLLSSAGMLNVHGLLGTTFDGGMSAETLLRWRPLTDGFSAGVRLSFPLK